MSTATTTAMLPALPALQGAVVAPIDMLVPGKYQPRMIFKEEAMEEMADSVRQHGVMEPILVRVLPNGKLEIVAGERRYRAAKMAGLKEVPVIIKVLDLLGVLQLQAIENIQRVDLHPLEEAKSFHLLHHPPEADVPGHSIVEIARMLDKDPSHISRRLVLMRLVPAAKDAFLAGHIVLQTAIAVARIPVRIQEKAFPQIMATRSGDETVVNHRDATKILQGVFMLRLAQAPFPIKDAKLVPAAGGCNVCEKRTGASPDLFDDVKEADTCTDPQCHSEKVAAWNAARKAKARKQGIDVIEGKAASALLKFGPSSTALNGDYVYLDEPLQELTGSPSTLAKLLGTLIKPSALFEHPRDKTLREIVTTMKATQVLKDNALLVRRPTKGQQTALVAPPAPGTGQSTAAFDRAAAKEEKERKALEARMAVDRGWRVALFKDVHKALQDHGENVSIVLRRAVAMELALTYLDDADNWALISDLWRWKAGADYRKGDSLRERLDKLLEPMTHSQLDLLAADLIMLPDLEVSSAELDHEPSTLLMAQACDDDDADLNLAWRRFRNNALAKATSKAPAKKVSRAREPSLPHQSPTPAGGIKGAATKAEAGKPATKVQEDQSQAPSAQSKEDGSDLPHWVGQIVKVKGDKRVGEISEIGYDGALTVAFGNGKDTRVVLRADIVVPEGQTRPGLGVGAIVRVRSKLGQRGKVLTRVSSGRWEVEHLLDPKCAWPFPVEKTRLYEATELLVLKGPKK